MPILLVVVAVDDEDTVGVLLDDDTTDEVFDDVEAVGVLLVDTAVDEVVVAALTGAVRDVAELLGDDVDAGDDVAAVSETRQHISTNERKRTAQ